MMSRSSATALNLLVELSLRTCPTPSSLNGFIVLETPLESLVEYSEFGARIVIDPDRAHSLVGIDLYANCNGKEVCLNRTDIVREQHAGIWMPSRIDIWERIDSPIPMTDRTQTRTSRVEIDWNSSTVNSPLSLEQITLGAIDSKEDSRVQLENGWTMVLFKSGHPMMPERRHGFFWLVIGNLIAIAVFAGYALSRRRFSDSAASET